MFMKGGRAGNAGGSRRHECMKLVVVAVALLIATWAWLSLIFHPKNHCSHPHRRGDWQAPPTAFSLDTPRRSREPSLDFSTGAIAATAWPAGGVSSDGTQLGLQNLVFGIAGSAQLWQYRKEFIKLWWRPAEMRGYVWLEEKVKMFPGETLPPIIVSEDTSRFSYTHPHGHPSGIRISRIISETFRLGLPDVQWFVMGDDDTVFCVDNLLRVLSKYDSSQMYYIGNPSESHRQNTDFSNNMAYGGGGFAISYPLAAALSEMQDDCMERYPELFGSDDRLKACISELGVPLTKEPGFHQFDIYGNALGLLAAHPIAPFLSVHHLELIDPVFPGYNTLDSLRLFTQAMQVDPASFLQQSITYDQSRSLTYSISLGYVVQVFPDIVLPKDVERPEVTFTAWNRLDNTFEFSMDSRPGIRPVCKQPFLFFMEKVQYDERNATVVSTYRRHKFIDERKSGSFCWSRMHSPEKVDQIRVHHTTLPIQWYKVPRRRCAELQAVKDKVLHIWVRPCGKGEIIAAS